MKMDSTEADNQVFESNVKKLSDVRRYDKRTLACPSGCGAELALFEIPRHDCVKDLKSQLKMMEQKLQSKEEGAQDDAGDRARKLEQISANIQELLNERSRQEEAYRSKEAFYQEQLAVLREQVVQLQQVLHERGRLANGVESIAEEEESGGNEWKLRYERLLADKIDLEKVFRERERGYQQEITALRAETSMLQQNLHMERKLLSLEHDRAACEKLESLTDQLEQLIKQKRQNEQRKHADTSAKNGRIRHRIHNSVGSWNSEISEIDEEEDAAQMN